MSAPIVTAALASFCCLLVAVISNNLVNGADNNPAMRITIFKYRIMDWLEIALLKHQEYQFDICACEIETANPENEERCTCDLGLLGKTAIKSLPYAIYPASCAVAPDMKCLGTEIGPISDQGYHHIYLHIHIDGASFTWPKWQPLPIRQKKSTVQLHCSRIKLINSCPTCRTCRAGKIELNYLISEVADQGLLTTPQPPTQAPVTGIAPPKYTRVPVPIRAARTQETFSDDEVKTTQPTVVDSANFVVPSDFDRKLANGDHDKLVRDHLMAASIKHQLQAAQFSIPKLKEHIMNLHTGYRKYHGASPLVYSADAERKAEQWAKRLASEQGCLHHDTDHTYGENLFYYGATWLSDEFTLAEATMSSFYAEKKMYNFNHYVHMDYFRTGHFTQMLWVDSQRIGIGVAISETNGVGNGKPCHPPFKATMVYISIKYDPPGNVQAAEYYMANVLKPVTGV